MNRSYDSSYTNTYDALSAYITKVFTRMGIALLITAAVAFLGYRSIMTGGLVTMMISGPGSLILLFVQFGLCFGLSARLTSMNNTTANLMMYAYAAVTGVTFSVLPLTFGARTVFTAFLYAGVMFLSASIIGHTTRTDMSKFSGILMGGLIALVLASILSFFIPFLHNSLMISYIGILLFLGITAWDMQRIKQMYYSASGTLQENLATFGSFQLYLDFLNIFLYVLQILGRRNND